MPISNRPKCPQNELRGNQVGRRAAYRLPILIAGYCDWAAKMLARWQRAHLPSTAAQLGVIPVAIEHQLLAGET
jgi:hypothetical protein